MLLVGYETFGANCLDFWYDDVRFVLSHDSIEFVAMEHAGEHFALVGHLHGWGVGVGVDCYDVAAESFHCYDKLLAEFA